MSPGHKHWDICSFWPFFLSLLAQLLVSWSFNVKTKQRKGEQIAIGRRCWTIRMPKGLEICKYRGCFALLYYLCIKLSELVFGTLLKAGFSICQLSLNFYVGFILHVFCISILFAWHCKLEINLKNTRWDFTDFPRLYFFCLRTQSSLHSISFSPIKGREDPQKTDCTEISVPWNAVTALAYMHGGCGASFLFLDSC